MTEPDVLAAMKEKNKALKKRIDGVPEQAEGDL